MKKYLGDSVYAEYKNGEVILTTENGNGPSNTIIMEDEVLSQLIAFTGHIMEEAIDKATNKLIDDIIKGK